MANLIEEMRAASTFGRVRVEVVADDDRMADPRIPKDVLAKLGPDDVMISKVGHMMYIRQSHWDRIKYHFPIEPIQ